MAFLRISMILLDDDADPVNVAEQIKAGFPEESLRVEIKHFDHKIPYKQAWRTVAEVCDVCGDLVDIRADPIFKEHNEKNYQRHVEIVNSDPNYPDVPRVF